MAMHAIKRLTLASCLVALCALPALAADEPAQVNRGTDCGEPGNDFG